MVERANSKSVSPEAVDLESDPDVVWALSQPTELDRFAGKWIAIENQKVLSVSGKVSDSFRKALQAGAKEPFLYWVPHHGHP
ncbi:MAG: hypothetical protein UU23_C0002G0024 [Candidatus Curtissbacteria bacterium GW2011_GWA1_40_9]|uniref:DUF5678 domain-containing protein n=1 Tax=Candidatus Curtissbacteria bacterium GW2011_GWA1_40_9 TaxID=1618408 RepID=A0A0G0WS47_9BACT|nr:MAG: hypothetical protein UU23_C0002G0024 [Candidatus Curtissbacteria bacterium GW2011_GWA1_40_9]